MRSSSASATAIAPPPLALMSAPELLERYRPTIERMLAGALNQYTVRRGRLKSIVAGYPWFLDWGRDALIVVRGLIAAGNIADAQEGNCLLAGGDGCTRSENTPRV